jgi:uncharacterized protein
MVRVHRAAPAPSDLGTAVIGVPEGSEIDLELQLESVVEGVYVTGTATIRAVGECSRCLDPMVTEHGVELQELYRYADNDYRASDDDDLPVLEDDLLDLEPMLRDAVVLALPLAPVCDDDCPGLCPRCGVRLVDDPLHEHDQIDPRWAALEGLGEVVANEPVELREPREPREEG